MNTLYVFTSRTTTVTFIGVATLSQPQTTTAAETGTGKYVSACTHILIVHTDGEAVLTVDCHKLLNGQDRTMAWPNLC